MGLVADTLVYWDNELATMFSTDTHYTDKFGLGTGEEIGGVHWVHWYVGAEQASFVGRSFNAERYLCNP